MSYFSLPIPLLIVSVGSNRFPVSGLAEYLFASCSDITSKLFQVTNANKFCFQLLAGTLVDLKLKLSFCTYGSCILLLRSAFEKESESIQ